MTDQETIDAFHSLYYMRGHHKIGTWRDTYWRGVRVEKYWMDLGIYAELIHDLRPDLIIETGTANGGSALFFADLMDLEKIDGGTIVSIDPKPRNPLPWHHRVVYLEGSSLAPGIAAMVRQLAGAGRVLVTLDSDHHAEHVAAELELYAPLVTRGSYLVVEDTNINGHPVLPDFGPGPADAVAAFLARRPEFEADRSRDKFLLTTNPGGWLRRLT